MDANSKKIPIYQIALVLLLPGIYWINAMQPWTKKLLHHEHKYWVSWTLSILTLHWTSVLLIFILLKKNGLKIQDIGYTFNTKETLYFTGSWLVFATVIFSFAEWHCRNVPGINEKIAWLGEVAPETSGERFWWIFVCFSAGFCEEFIYRGFGISGLVINGVNKSVSLLISSVSFVLMHGPRVIMFIGHGISILIFGLIFGTMFLLTKRIWISMAIHILWDYLLFFVPFILAAS